MGNVLNTESLPQHNIAGLISGITFILLFSQEKPLTWKEINTNTGTAGDADANSFSKKVIFKMELHLLIEINGTQNNK